jgi:ferredoxin-NADP reductase
MADKLKVKIKPLALMDLLAFKNLIPKRKKMFAAASAAQPDAKPPANVLAKRLDPVRQYLTVAEVIEETPHVRSFKLIPDPERGGDLAVFRAGQYLSVKLDIDGEHITRPYSIASSPKDALDGYYTLIVKRAAFATDYIWERWTPGAAVETSGPEGTFYYTHLRDLSHLAGIAGGSGITPFISMLRDFRDKNWPVDFTLFYGCNGTRDIVRRAELDALAGDSGGKLNVVYVIAGGPAEPGMETGFITKELLGRYKDLCDGRHGAMTGTSRP